MPEDAQGNLVGKGDIAQTRQVLTNLKTIVQESGGRVAGIVKITIFMVELTPSAYEWVSKLQIEFFGGDYPTSTMVEVKRLAKPEWLIKIEAWAVI